MHNLCSVPLVIYWMKSWSGALAIFSSRLQGVRMINIVYFPTQYLLTKKDLLATTIHLTVISIRGITYWPSVPKNGKDIQK